jgi:hypothetical protein
MPTIEAAQLQIILVLGTTSPTIGTQTSHAHTAGIPPRFYTIKSKAAGVVYESAPSDQTNIFIKGTVASLAFEATCCF